MGAIAVAFNMRREDAVSSVITMLQELRHRGASTVQIVTPDFAITTRSLQELKNRKPFSYIAAGLNFSQTSKQKPKSKTLPQNFSLVFEGGMFPASEVSDTDTIAQELEPQPQRNAHRILKRHDGAYAFAIILANRIILGRDSFGMCPFYYGQDGTIWAAASERKALWKLNMKKVRSFPPGNLATVTARGAMFKIVAPVRQPNPKRVSVRKAARRLHHLLLKSILERTSDVEKIAVAFSGGLDSSVAAVLAKTCKKEVSLITVGLKGQPELQYAEAAAKAIKLPLLTQAYTIGDVEKALRIVLWLIEEPNPVKASIAIPLFWAAQIASKAGCHVLLAGQGADEMFGGYHKYLEEYARKGAQNVQRHLFQDLVMSYETNFQRDNPVCAFAGVDLRLPFIDREVARFALSLPVSVKIKSSQDNLRKLVLRRMAEDMDIPRFIAKRPKKAVQYATGVNRALKGLARCQGVTQRDYVKQIFQRIYPSCEG